MVSCYYRYQTSLQDIGSHSVLVFLHLNFCGLSWAHETTLPCFEDHTITPCCTTYQSLEETDIMLACPLSA